MFCGSLRLFRAKKKCFDRRLGTKHLQPESACVDGFGIAKREPLGEVLKVTLKTSPGMLVSSILASPASKEEFNYILYNKDYQNAGTTCFPRFCCHWHYTIMQAASRTTANGSGTPPLCLSYVRHVWTSRNALLINSRHKSFQISWSLVPSVSWQSQTLYSRQ